jgi:hypothetical protein
LNMEIGSAPSPIVPIRPVLLKRNGNDWQQSRSPQEAQHENKSRALRAVSLSVHHTTATTIVPFFFFILLVPSPPPPPLPFLVHLRGVGVLLLCYTLLLSLSSALLSPERPTSIQLARGSNNITNHARYTRSRLEGVATEGRMLTTERKQCFQVSATSTEPISLLHPRCASC